jgi:carbamoyltransferase
LIETDERRKVLILGLNAFHGDSSAAIVRDGRLVAAAEEERFRRLKHWAGFPTFAIEYCLREAGVTLGDVDHVAINQNSLANIGPKIRYLISNVSSAALALERFSNRQQRQRVPELMSKAFPTQQFRGAFHRVEHHLAHLSSAFHVSPFEEAVAVSIDGFGDFASTAWGVGRGERVAVDGRVLFPHSLGIFYQALTQYLGFPNYGDEYKVMGLAPYGSPSLVEEMKKIVKLRPGGRFVLDLSYFSHHRQSNSFQWNDRQPMYADLFTSALEELFGPRRMSNDQVEKRHFDVAYATQAVYEETTFHLLNELQRSSGLTDIALAGGCANNSVANGKIRRKTRFRRVYVQAAAGDAGGAIGAAISIWHKLGGSRRFEMDHAYWGPSYAAEQIGDVIDKYNLMIDRSQCDVQFLEDDAQLCERVAARLVEGKVVGWFQGRMEWGPRALGNRSILCDPRRADMKAILNEKIKRRESFRPFAPSVLEEEVANWFEEVDKVPFMMQVFQIRSERRIQIPSVTHVDGSGRLQTVSALTNPKYHSLIKAFERLTGVPMVLNTSFNENEPVVCSPSEALECFIRTAMDSLVLGNWLIERRS